MVALQRVRAGDLAPNPKNWRKHPEAQVAALRSVLSEVGIADAVLARKLSDGRLQLIDGHLRQSLDPEQRLPVLVLDVTEAEADVLLATLDPLAAMAKGDADALEKLLGTIDAGQDVTALLESIAASAGLLPEESPADAAPDPPKRPTTKRGDVWLLGGHRLVCGDATDEQAVAAACGEATARMVFTDPPYGVGYAGAPGSPRPKIANDGKADQPLETLLLASLKLAAARTVDGAACYVCFADSHVIEVRSAFAAAGWRYSCLILWIKNTFVLSRGDYHLQHEPILYGWKASGGGGRSGKHAWYGGRKRANVVDGLDDPSTVWRCDKPSRSAAHPTMKPTALVARALRNSSRPGDLVLDPFAGSDSTLIACEQERRACAAIELEPGYCDVIIQRWQEATGGKAKRGR